MSGPQKSILRTLIVGIAAIGIIPIFVGGRALRRADAEAARGQIAALLIERTTAHHPAADSASAPDANGPRADGRTVMWQDSLAAAQTSRPGGASTWEKVRTLFN